MERDHYSLIIVGDELSPIRRLDVPKPKVRRILQGAVLGAVVLLAGMVDYVRLRIEHLELDDLRVQSAEQRARLENFDEVLAGVQSRLEQLGEFERKVRIIANLPGSAGTGGEDVVEVTPRIAEDPEGPRGGAELPLEVDAEGAAEVPIPPQAAFQAGSAAAAEVLRSQAQHLEQLASVRVGSLEELIVQLEGKRDRLESSPSIWPAEGWLTSRFGMRVSPFTGRRQFHAGLDIAGAPGTDIVAPARGRVSFAGKRGPLGNSLTIDHGYGVRTLYGHAKDLRVKRGDQVERGQLIATLGNSGRSTGPHLHYVVEVEGKAKNPLDYIFD